MKRAWLGLVVCGWLGACDDATPTPTEEIATDGPVDDDGEDDSSTGASTTTSTSTSSDATTSPGPATTDTPGTDTGSDPTDETSAGESTTGAPTRRCSGETANITQQGNVIASSVFDTLLGPAYEADLSVDGDIATSWFSAGPEKDGTESTYEWYTQAEHCIDGIGIFGNAMHANPDFREGFGFESATVEVIDSSGVVTFSEDIDLSGTPDPDLGLEPGGVFGTQVILHLRGHESEDCGGFAELVIDGRVAG